LLGGTKNPKKRDVTRKTPSAIPIIPIKGCLLISLASKGMIVCGTNPVSLFFTKKNTPENKPYGTQITKRLDLLIKDRQTLKKK
jgi:hypothetical protein